MAHRAFGIDDDFAIVWPIAVEKALAAGQTNEGERLLGYIVGAPAGLVTPLAHAHLLRLRALTAESRGDSADEIDRDLELAIQEFRELGARFYLARALLERARRMAQRGDSEAAAPLIDEAEAIFTDLRASRWIAEIHRSNAVH